MGTATISATEAARSFSELVNNVRYRGDRYTIVRGGRPVAVMGPVDGQHARRTLGELAELVQSLPGLDPDDASFEADLAEAAARQPPVPGTPPWE